MAAPAHYDDVGSAARRLPDNRIHRRRVHDAHFSVRPAAGHGARRAFGDELGGPIESREEGRTSVVGSYLQSPSKQVGQTHCRHIHSGHRTRVPRDSEALRQHPIRETDQKQRIHRHDRKNCDPVACVGRSQ